MADSAENVAVPKALLNRICGMVYASRGEQLRMNYVTDHEYTELVRLRHSGHDAIETVMTALRSAEQSQALTDKTDAWEARQVPCPECGSFEKVPVYECDRCYHAWSVQKEGNAPAPQDGE